MLGKCYGKLDANPDKVLGYYIQAIAHSSGRDRNDPIFEPHHKLISATYKYFKQGRLTVYSK